MFCAYCGVKLDSEARFCASCGKATITDPVVHTKPEIQEPTYDAQKIEAPPDAHPPPQPGAYNTSQPQPQFQPQLQPQTAPYTHPKKKSGKPLNKTRLEIILSACAVVIITAIVLVMHFVTMASSYNNAIALMADGNYLEAQVIFVDLGGYRDASELADECQIIMDYNAALQLMDRGMYREAKAAFEALSPFRDSDAKAAECQKGIDYETAIGIMASGDYEQAQALFEKLGTYKDSASLFIECGNWIIHGEAVALMGESKYADAIAKLEPLVEQGFADSATLLIECENWILYGEALALMDSGRFNDALVKLEALVIQGFEDSLALITECYNNITYIAAVSAFDDGMFYTAFRLFSSLADFKDSAEMAELCAQDFPPTGAIYRNSDFSGTAVTIRIRNTNDDSQPTLLKIYTEDNVLVMSLFINSGGTRRIRLPAGTYIIKQAYGENWYGIEEMFGDEGAVYQTLIFEDGAAHRFQRNYTYTLTLRSIVDGNVGARNESRESF